MAGPVSGVLLDRWDRRRIMIASDLVRAVIALAFVLTIHQPRPWLLYVLSAGLMFASPFFTAAPRFHSADHRQHRTTARRELAHPNHAMGHAHGRHAPGRLQRGNPRLLLGVRDQLVELRVLRGGHLANRRPRGLSRQASRPPRPGASRGGTTIVHGLCYMRSACR